MNENIIVNKIIRKIRQKLDIDALNILSKYDKYLSFYSI